MDDSYHGEGLVDPVGAEPVARRHRFILALLRRLPQAALSRFTGRLADLPVPRPLRGPLYRFLARRLGARPEEAAEPLRSYRSVNDFFVRPLRAGVRSWPADPGQAASPVDGVAGPMGAVTDGMLLQAKGVVYRLDDLLASEEEGRALEGGHFLTLYLAPRHYHRVHAPLDGAIHQARYAPGRLLPVTPWARRGVTDLFPRNERLVVFMEGSAGRMALVAVGAFNVGRISATYDPPWNGRRWGAVTNRQARRRSEVRHYDEPVLVSRGQELLRFNLGSTVILVWEGKGGSPAGGPSESPIESPAPQLRPGDEVRLGQPILPSPG